MAKPSQDLANFNNNETDSRDDFPAGTKDRPKAAEVSKAAELCRKPFLDVRI